DDRLFIVPPIVPSNPSPQSANLVFVGPPRVWRKRSGNRPNAYLLLPCVTIPLDHTYQLQRHQRGSYSQHFARIFLGDRRRGLRRDDQWSLDRVRSLLAGLRPKAQAHQAARIDRPATDVCRAPGVGQLVFVPGQRGNTTHLAGYALRARHRYDANAWRVPHRGRNLRRDLGALPPWN